MGQSPQASCHPDLVTGLESPSNADQRGSAPRGSERRDAAVLRAARPSGGACARAARAPLLRREGVPLRPIKEAQSLGFTLGEIEEHLRLTGRGAASDAIRVRVAAKIDQVDEKIANLRRVRDELARVLGCACDSVDRCTCGAALGDSHAFAATHLVLTDEGRNVLAGDADRIAVAGIDRWLGGTYLRPGSVWRWDPEARRVRFS